MLVRRNHLIPALPDFDRLLGDVFRSSEPSASRHPAINAWDDETKFVVEAELPGFSKEDLDISLANNRLTIAGSRKETQDEGTTYHTRERRSGRFERSIRFPVDVEGGEVDASFENGVLRVELPKAKTALPRKITVKG